MTQRFLLSILLLSSAFLNAQTGRISGTVKTSDGQAGEFVTVALKGTQKVSVANSNGSFVIEKIGAGTYTLFTNFPGLEPMEQPVTVVEGETANVGEIILKENSKELNEVVISTTANKRNPSHGSSSLRLQTPLLETAQNIQVISSESLRDQQSFDMLEGVQRNVSGAQKVEHWDNYANINMRGSQVTAFRNGMNVQMPWGPLAEDVSMVDRIEFVKGPAGFMLANGEPSGFYNVVTKKPSGYNKGEVTFTAGSFDTYRGTFDSDGKLSTNGKLLYRLNMMGQLKGSHRDFEYNNRYSLAPVIRYKLDDHTNLTFEYTHQFSQMNVIGSNYAFSKRKYADLPVNFTTAESNLDPTEITDRSVLAVFEHSLNPDWKVTAQGALFHYQQTGQSIWPTFISSANDSFMQRGISIWDALGINKTAQIFVNGKVRTGGLMHTILGGVDMSHKDYYADWNQGASLGDSTFNIYQPVYGQVSASEVQGWDRSKEIRIRGVRYNYGYNALYVQDELAMFGNRVRLTLAGRYTTNRTSDPYSPSTNDSKFTPRAGLSISVRKDLALYTMYDQAFVANPGLDWQKKSFDPVTGDNIEGGIKKEWLKGRWSSVASVYRITKNNVLTADLEHPDPVTGQFVYSRQTGQQQVQGIEVDVRGNIAANIDVVLNYAYTDAIITKDSDPRVVGNRVAGATAHIQNTWLNYRIKKGPAKGLKISIGSQYQAGRSSWFIFDNTENALPDYMRLDAAIGYQKNNFTIALNINNLLNEYLYSGAPYYGMYYWQTEPLRNGRVTIGYRF